MKVLAVNFKIAPNFASSQKTKNEADFEYPKFNNPLLLQAKLGETALLNFTGNKPKEAFTKEQKQALIDELGVSELFTGIDFSQYKNETFNKAYKLLSAIDTDRELEFEQKFDSSKIRLLRYYRTDIIRTALRDENLYDNLLRALQYELTLTQANGIASDDSVESLLGLLEKGYKYDSLNKLPKDRLSLASDFADMVIDSDKKDISFKITNTGYPFVVNARWDAEAPEESQVTLTYFVDGQFTSLERNEKFKNGVIESSFNHSNRVYRTVYDGRKIISRTEIVSDKDGTPVEIIYSKASDVLDGAYDMTSYKLSDYDESVDMVKEIEAGNLKGGKILSRAYKNPDGEIIYEEDVLTYDGGRIQRNYKTNKGGYDYTFIITDKNGKRTLDLNKKFEKISSNKTRTTINGKEYIATFDDKEKLVEITSKRGKTFVDMGSRIFKDARLWEACKKLPADAFAGLKEISAWHYDEKRPHVEPRLDPDLLYSYDDVAVNLHELGHVVDDRRMIHFDDELAEIYEKELREFDKRHTSSAGKIPFRYFSKIHDEQAGKIGLNELIAETNVILSTVTLGGEHSTRTWLLAQNFPQTISRAAIFLMSNVL